MSKQANVLILLASCYSNTSRIWVYAANEESSLDALREWEATFGASCVWGGVDKSANRSDDQYLPFSKSIEVPSSIVAGIVYSMVKFMAKKRGVKVSYSSSLSSTGDAGLTAQIYELNDHLPGVPFLEYEQAQSWIDFNE